MFEWKDLQKFVILQTDSSLYEHYYVYITLLVNKTVYTEQKKITCMVTLFTQYIFFTSCLPHKFHPKKF